MSLPKIDHDTDMNRYYIPLPGGWEIQTKGKGSSFRIAQGKDKPRQLVTDTYLQPVLERMGRDIHAAFLALHPEDKPVEPFKVGEFYSSSDPEQVVLLISRGSDYAQDEKHHSFIRWVASNYSTPTESQISDAIEGADVSVDISTGDHDADARIYGKVTEVMTVEGGSNKLTILVEPDEPFVKVPQGYVLAKSELNKAEMIGEFSVDVNHTCSACSFHGAQTDCEVCAGEIEYNQLHTIPWTTIKEIYAAGLREGMLK